ncbi:MAG: sulfite exporter TauE/SafE family protein [Rhizobiaceae bacterium]
MTDLLQNPIIYAVAIPAVLLVGLSKGGFGGALGVVGVPLMALVLPPVQAAAILLPILVLMDIAALWAWRQAERDWQTIRNLLPGAIVGIGIGWLTAAIVTEAAVKLIVGLIAFGFVLRWVWQKYGGREKAGAHNALSGAFWGALSGFTSFVAHAGGPPYQVYALPLRQDPKLYTATSVVFFAVVNAVKLIPYFALGELDTGNLTAAAALMPFAFIATVAGAAIVKRMRAEVFYPITYALVFLLSLKLIWDGAVEVW